MLTRSNPRLVCLLADNSLMSPQELRLEGPTLRAFSPRLPGWLARGRDAGRQSSVLSLAMGLEDSSSHT